MKLDKKLHELHAKRLAAILNPQSTFAPHLNRPEFMTLLKLELNTLNAIEKILSEDKLEEKLTSDYLSKQFTTLTKTEFKLGEKFKFDDNDDLIDNVNYLPTYCKNIFKVNIDDVVEGKKVTASNPNISLKSKPEAGDEPMMDAAAAFNMGAMGYGAGPYDNPFLMGKAYGKLNKDIAEGKVYQYKTKPRIIVVCKYLLAVLLSLSLLSLILTSIFCFIANGLNVTLHDTSATATTLFTVTNGIFYLICAGFGVYILYITIKSFVKKHGKVNENSLYQFSWYFYLSYIILALLIILLDLRTTWFHDYFTITEAASSTHNIGFEGWKIGIVVTAGLTGACIVPMILGAVYAPKQDKEKIENILKQYIDEVVPPSQQGPDVQKPVDVKTSETKKETKDDKKESKDSKPKK